MATLSVPYNGVNAPAAGSAVVAPLDFSKLVPDYQQGVQFGQQQAVHNAFSGGLPTGADGQPDFQAAAMKLYQLGAPDQAAQMMQAGMNQQAFGIAKQELGTPQPAASAGATPTAQPTAAPINNNAPGPQTNDFYSINHGLESGGDPTAHNPDSGPAGTAAYGLAGFMPGTWQHLVQAHPELGLPADITKATGAQQQAASQALTGENAGYLAQNGVPVTDRTARIANFLGGGGAVKFFNGLSQNPGAPAASLFPKEAAANPDSFYMPDGKTPRTLAQLFQYETVQLPLKQGLQPFGSGNTTGFNYQPAQSRGGPTAVAANGASVQTNGAGQAIDPATGQPTPGAAPSAGGGRPAVRITNQPTPDTSVVMRAADGQTMPVSAAQSPAVNALAQALAARAAQNGGMAPGGAASPTGSPAAASAASIAGALAHGDQATAPNNVGSGLGGFGTVGPIGAPGVSAPAPAQREIAQGDTSEPATSYAENLAKPPPSNPPPSRNGGAALPTNQVAGPGAPSGQPQQAAAQPAPQPPSAPNPPPSPRVGLMDPTLGNLVPAGMDPGAYAAALYRKAAALSLSPVTAKMGEVIKDQADRVTAAITSSITSRSPAMQEYQLNRQQKADGSWESPAETQARAAGLTEQSKADVTNANTLEKTTPVAGGPEVFDTRAHLLKAIQDGNAGPNSSVGPGAGSPPGGGGVPPNLPVAQQPKFIAARQAEIAKDEGTMMQQYQARQIAKERLGELADLTETYQTGDLNGAKAKMQGLAKAWGVPLPNSPTMNAAAYEEFTKNAIGNVFAQAKDLGGRILVSELSGLTKANANAELQPEAAAKIIAQGSGILNYEDKHFEQYHAWKNQNPNAYDTSGFEIPFIKANPVKQFSDQALQQIAPLGAAQPKSAADLKVGQVYQSPNGHGIGRWDGKQFVPETRPASQRLFQPVTGTN